MEDIALMLRLALPLDDVDHFLLGPADGQAVVWIDISERSDLRALADRHRDRGGYCVCTWLSINPGRRNMLVGLRVEMHQPIYTVFHLTFHVQHYIEQLSLVAQAGKVWIVPGPPPAHLVGTQEMTAQDFLQEIVSYSGSGVLIEFEPHLMAELRNQLEEWKRIK